MTKQQLRTAWERNGVWVRNRYPDLSEADVERLEELFVIPLPTGQIEVSPATILDLDKRLIALAANLTRMGAKKTKAKEA